MTAPVERWEIPTPFPVGTVNGWRLAGDPRVLIDAGPRTPEALAALDRHLAKSPVDVLIVTHEHVDHAGLARHVQQHGVEVWLHETEARVLRRWAADSAAREADYAAGLAAAQVVPRKPVRPQAAKKAAPPREKSKPHG